MGKRVGGTPEGKCPDLSRGRGAAGSCLESLLPTRWEEVRVWGEQVERTGGLRSLHLTAVCCQNMGDRVACSPQRTEEHGEGGVGDRGADRETLSAKRPQRQKGCVSKSRNEVGSIFLRLVNCYHFGRIVTSFGSCLSEIHNMCSLH